MDISGFSGATTEPEWIKTSVLCAERHSVKRLGVNQFRNILGVQKQVCYTSLQLRNKQSKGLFSKLSIVPCIVCVCVQGELGGNGFISVRQQQL